MPGDRGFAWKDRKGESDGEYGNATGAGRGLRTLGGGTLNTVTPCAACKLLRRRCSQECPFCPYFSPEESHKFASVHKVFGASNVSKMLMDVPKSLRARAAESLVYEANVRQRDPVYGCSGAIWSLQRQIEDSKAQLNAIRAEIFKYKNGRNTNIQPPSPYRTVLTSATISAAPNDLCLPLTPSLSDADSSTISYLENNHNNNNDIAYYS